MFGCIGRTTYKDSYCNLPLLKTDNLYPFGLSPLFMAGRRKRKRGATDGAKLPVGTNVEVLFVPIFNGFFLIYCFILVFL